MFFAAKVFGERRVGVRERLILADEAAQFRFESFETPLELDIVQRLRGRG